MLKTTTDPLLKPIILTREQLKEYAKQLGYTHEIADVSDRFYASILSSLRSDESTLNRIYTSFSQALAAEKLLLPSSTEWFLDNYYVINEQIQSVKQGLTKGFYRDLVTLKSGPLREYPRIYSIAIELLAHTDNRVDKEIVIDFVLSYESVSPLTSVELWALPMMLRLVWIGNLCRLMEKAEETFQKRKLATNLAQSFVQSRSRESDNLSELGALLRDQQNPDAMFLIWLLRSLRDKDHVTPLIHWLEQYIEQEDINIEEVVNAENQKQAANRVSTGNVVSSMRLISSLDWSNFFETMSLVERILEQDPAGVYGQMDFKSRDRYRHAIENLSHFSTYNEQEIARRAIKLARTGTGKKQHVGYYLIDQGITEFKKNIGYTAKGSRVYFDFIERYPTAFYLLGLAFFTVVGMLLLALFLAIHSVPIVWSLVGLIPCSVPASVLLNKLITAFSPPITPPKLEFKRGIPHEFRTLVVVPCMVGSEKEIQNLSNLLERRYLTNKDENLFFALLTDFPDAEKEHMADEESLIESLQQAIVNLNARYKGDRENIFYLFHRPRVYNPHEKIWMGWERKRGKLEDLNRFLLGDDHTHYSIIVGDQNQIRTVKYVITLDADTQMPLNTAVKLVGTMAHPLNRPEVDAKKRRVVSGYGIIQPRLNVHAPSAAKSLFTRIFASDAGLDPYHSVISNIYQDFFHNAVYVGKAIYDVHVFHQCLDKRFPENRLLSHDLLEGNFLRVGLASDIELLEDFPASYTSFSWRQRRWIQGDWQVIAWLFDPTLGVIEKWKILDNLRRCLIVPAGFFMLLWGWFMIPNVSAVWSFLTIGMVFFPLLELFFTSITTRLPDEDWDSYLPAFFDEIYAVLVRAIVTISFMAYETMRNSSAILLALYRTTFNQKGTLEWTSHAAAERKAKSVRGMYSAVLLGMILSVWWLVYGAHGYFVPLFFTIMWIVSPALSYFISKPEVHKTQTLSMDEDQDLLLTARRIWRFFDEFANADNNFLPPDNIQVSPGPIIAQRTSPTNIGFSLLAAVSAYDFGFICKDELYETIKNTFATLDKLEKHQGHFLNWYRTDTLLPLQPSYVSTVDSGNLATALIAIKQACVECSKKSDDTALFQSGWDTAWKAWKEDWQFLSKRESSQLPVPLSAPKNDKELRHITGKAVSAIETLRLSHDLQKIPEVLTEISLYEEEALKLIGPDRIKKVTYWNKVIHKIYKQNAQGSMTTPESWLTLAERAMKMVIEMNFTFLFNSERKVFSIGFNVAENRTDDSYYNLLATEARLASFIAIALGQVPEQHWFALGRPLTKIHGKTVLLSWGGTMFEYLMPHLLMRSFDNTLLWQSKVTVIERQMEYGKMKSMPWGMSESGFFAFDYQYNYQYQQFGIPDLSLKAETIENLVISPYATLLTLPIKPKDAFQNLQRLKEYGLTGTYGFYEAADFTPVRIPKHEKVGIIKSYMAHHQGMSLVAINNYFHDNILQRRFHADPMVAGAELLLGERIPVHISKVIMPEEAISISRDAPIESTTTTLLGITDAVRSTILSNSAYSLVVSNSGTGGSTWRDLDITRQALDTTENNWGWFCFIKDTETSEVWSATYQPFLKKPDHYSARFSSYKAEFERVDDDLEVRTSVVVAMDENVEVHQITLTNKGKSVRNLEITDYAEVVGMPHRADSTHPAFGKLFVESEYVSARQALLFNRRRRGEHDKELWIWHTVRGNDEKVLVSGYETDRNIFIGRGKTILNAQAFTNHLSQTVGATFDPIMSLRTKIALAPNESIKLNYMTGVTESKIHAESLIDQFADPGEVERTFKLSEIHSQIELRHLGITAEEARLFQRLGSKILYPDSYFRAAKEILEQNMKGQSGLFPYGISGDFPIVLIKTRTQEGLKLIKQVLLAHEFLRTKQVLFDLVILNEESLTYSGELREGIQSLIDRSLSRPLVDKPGGIYVRDSSFLSHADKILLDTTARVVLDSQWGALEDNFELVPKRVMKQNVYSLPRPIAPNGGNAIFSKVENGMNATGDEFVIHTRSGVTSPLPWSNVIANPNFGTLVTSGGLGFTWSANSQLNRITTWSNDPVTEKPGEVLFIKDHEEWWSSTPLPINTQCEYTISHGWGYTRYECSNKNILTHTKVWVDADDPVKIVLLTVKNQTKRQRTIHPIYYAELVIGDNREKNQFFIVTGKDAITGALTARNRYNDVYSEHVSFLQSTEETTYTADRTEFLGRGGLWSHPEYLNEANGKLSGNIGAGLDPAFVMEATVTLAPDEEKQIAFVIGQGINNEEYLRLAEKYKGLPTIHESFDKSYDRFRKRLTAIQIHTPDEKLNTLTNGWLPYQVLSGRFWGRSSFFQSGGAFGFRDQLQDVLALLYSDPQLARTHILYSAEHQFIQGDVMHWWHPHTTRGVRTRMTDDFLWLPYAVSHYIAVTNDTGILDEKVSFMDLAPLADSEKERYDEAVVTKEQTSIYLHCIRALENGMKVGKHGLPLMGTGDWNDGLNSVGSEGHGESVWLAWFQYDVYSKFSKLCKQFGDLPSAARYLSYAKKIRVAAENHGWDGAWYKRAYFDTGESLGSRENTEAMIDSISQTWSVISGGATDQHARLALKSVEKHLVLEKDKLILLLTPPFKDSKPFPGYISGYLPGTRENGGQYTHAAAWLPLAYAKLGNGDRAVELLDMINPLNHTDTEENLNTYKGEPYVLAGDVYSHPQHIGRVGWSWYTGSASWVYRTIIENIIGLTLSGNLLSFDPCVPGTWSLFSIDYRWKETDFTITFKNPNNVTKGVTQIKFDSILRKSKIIQLLNDKKHHDIEITMGIAE